MILGSNLVFFFPGQNNYVVCFFQSAKDLRQPKASQKSFTTRGYLIIGCDQKKENVNEIKFMKYESVGLH